MSGNLPFEQVKRRSFQSWQSDGFNFLRENAIRIPSSLMLNGFADGRSGNEPGIPAATLYRRIDGTYLCYALLTGPAILANTTVTAIDFSSLIKDQIIEDRNVGWATDQIGQPSAFIWRISNDQLLTIENLDIAQPGGEFYDLVFPIFCTELQVRPFNTV